MSYRLRQGGSYNLAWQSIKQLSSVQPMADAGYDNCNAIFWAEMPEPPNLLRPILQKLYEVSKRPPHDRRATASLALLGEVVMLEPALLNQRIAKEVQGWRGSIQREVLLLD